MSFFFYFTKKRTGPIWGGELVPVGSGRRCGKSVGGEYGTNTVYTFM
jgi:hypothetical protein